MRGLLFLLFLLTFGMFVFATTEAPACDGYGYVAQVNSCYVAPVQQVQSYYVAPQQVFAYRQPVVAVRSYPQRQVVIQQQVEPVFFKERVRRRQVVVQKQRVRQVNNGAVNINVRRGLFGRRSTVVSVR